MGHSSDHSARSQRSDGYRGGVQAGTTAASEQSVQLEQLVRDSADQLGQRLGVRDALVWIPGYDGATLAEMFGADGAALAGSNPDGGVWALRGRETRPLVVVEAKKQGELGNAIERWYKNWAVAQRLGAHTYLTFCCGDGFFDGRSAQRILETAVAMEEPARLGGEMWNQPHGRLWMYRYRTAGDATGITAVVARAVRDAAQARCTTKV